MSRGFVKEDDQEEIPFVPPRADLPEGVANYVTQFGMDALQIEREKLINERENLDTTNEKDYRISANHINARLQLLAERIGTAKLIEPDVQLSDEIRFGATVTLKIKATNKIQQFQMRNPIKHFFIFFYLSIKVMVIVAGGHGGTRKVN